MPVDYLSLTTSQQKKLSEIRRNIKRYDDIINTEKEIKETAPDTYIVDRAKNSLAYNVGMLEKYEAEYQKKIEEHKNNIAAAEETLAKEKNRKSRNTVTAEVMIKRLEKELEELGLPQVSTLTQPVAAPAPAPPSKPVASSAPALSVSFKEFMSLGSEEEELAKSRARRAAAATEETTTSDPDSESENFTEQECQEISMKQNRYVEERLQERPPIVTNTKAKKPVKQVVRRELPTYTY